MSATYTAQRLPYKELLWDAAFRIGLQPDSNAGTLQFTAVDEARLSRFLSNAMKWAWEKCMGKDWVWPWIVQTATVTPSSGAIALSDLDYARWFSLWSLDPRNINNPGYSIDATCDGTSIWLNDNSATSIFAFYIGRAPEFSNVPIGTTTAWNANTICYDSGTEECYRAVVNGALGSQVADTTKWVVQPVYKNFQSAVAQMAHAMWLRSLREHDAAMNMEQLATEDLEAEFRGIFRQSPPGARADYYATGRWI